MKMKRVGFFAGTFDPIHDGHLEVARSAVHYLELDKLLFMVEEEPWSRKQPVAVMHRRAMVDIAAASDSKLEQLVNPIRQFSIKETLPILERTHSGSELYFIFGGDVFMKMNKQSWPNLTKLLKHHIVVFERAGVSNQQISDYARTLGIVVAIVPSVHASHSSTDVRLKPHKKTIWVPKDVATYIDTHNLYDS
jgi:nicotinate-nucleotide adenylyltransferase